MLCQILFSVTFWNILARARLGHMYHMTKAVQSAMVGSMVVFGALTYCALLHPICYLKTAQMNMQDSLIQEVILYKF